MNELFCPFHGIPAVIGWVFLGGDPSFFFFTIRYSYGRMVIAMRYWLAYLFLRFVRGYCPHLYFAGFTCPDCEARKARQKEAKWQSWRARREWAFRIVAEKRCK